MVNAMVTLITLLWMIAVLGKRAVYGPQPQIARLSLTLILGGLLLLGVGVDDVESLTFRVGAIVTQLGMLGSVIMIWSGVLWRQQSGK